MKNQEKNFLDYSFFKAASNTIISPFIKFMLIIFVFYSIITFSDDGLFNSLSENIISEYNISMTKYNSIKVFIYIGII